MQHLFLSPWSAGVLVAAVLLLVALVVVRLLRERRQLSLARQWAPLGLRVLVIAGLLFIALNPTAVIPRRESGRPHLAVLVDTSASMATADVDGGSRLAAVIARLDDGARARLERDFHLHPKAFDASLRPLELSGLSPEDAAGDATDLGPVLAAAVGEIAERPGQAGILLISDGRSTGEGLAAAEELALARSVPVWACPLGGPVERRDLAMRAPNAEILAFAGEEVQLNATLHSVGFPHRAHDVQLLRDGTVVEQVRAVPADGEAAVAFTVAAPATGEQAYDIRVPAEPGEADPDNNARTLYVRAVGAKVRVLVVEGQPHWDTKFLVQSCKRNPHVDVTAIHRLASGQQFTVLSDAAGERRDTGDHFPRSAEDFARYDCIVCGRGCEAFFDETTEELLAQFVAEQGGSLVLARGRPYGGRFPPLARLEPVIWGQGTATGVQPRIAEDALDSPLFAAFGAEPQAMIDSLPPLAQVQHTIGLKPLAQVLATAGGPDGDAVIAYQLYGQGRVLSINAGGLWRWSFNEGDQQRDDHLYDHFWTGVLRWLQSSSDFVAGHDIALRSARRRYTDEQPLRFLIRTRGVDPEAYRPRLEIVGEGETTTVEPTPVAGGQYRTSTAPLPPGAYTVRLHNNVGRPAVIEQEISVVSASVEQRELSADPALLERLATATDAAVVPPDELGGLLERVRRWQARRILADDRHALWDTAWLMLLLFALLGVELYLRRRRGLL